MTWQPKPIDVDDAEALASLTAHAAHRNNPFAYRLECPKCGSQVWPQQMIDVRALPEALTHGDAYRCDGCLSRWLRDARQVDGMALDPLRLITLLGAPPDVLTAYNENHPDLRR